MMNICCRQIPELDYPDGVHTIFLSTKGTNDDETPDEIVKFLKYVSANLSESTQDFGSDFVSRLQESVERIKHSRSKEREFMVLDDLIEIATNEGREEGLAEGRELQAFNTTKYLYSIGLNNDQIAAAVGFSVADVEKWLASDK